MEWINIKDKLPDNENWVRVCLNNQPSVIPCCYSGSRWYEYRGSTLHIPEVTHWKEFNNEPPHQPKLIWQFISKKNENTDWTDLSDDEYEQVKHLARFEFRQVEK